MLIAYMQPTSDLVRSTAYVETLQSWPVVRTLEQCATPLAETTSVQCSPSICLHMNIWGMTVTWHTDWVSSHDQGDSWWRRKRYAAGHG